jgi:Flp pilus assembly protein TadG
VKLQHIITLRAKQTTNIEPNPPSRSKALLAGTSIPPSTFAYPGGRGVKVSQSASGQALVEFMLVFTVLALVLFGVFDLGRGIYAYTVCASAAREGARYGIALPNDGTGIQNRALANTAALDPSQITVTSACSPNCNIGSSITVTVNYTFRPVTLLFANVPMTGIATMTIE